MGKGGGANPGRGQCRLPPDYQRPFRVRPRFPRIPGLSPNNAEGHGGGPRRPRPPHRSEGAAATSSPREVTGDRTVEAGAAKEKPATTKTKKRKKTPTVKRLTPDAVIRRLKFGQSGISCCLDHFGEDGPYFFNEGTVVYVNRDHPLYQREAKKAEPHTMHLARLLTQEIALMKDPRNPRQAFERQSRLLRDAFIDD